MKKILFTLLTFLCALNMSAQYKVGDYYEKDGLKGIVVRVDDSGEHGLIMSLERCGRKWLDDKSEKYNTGAFFEDDGEKNMTSIENFLKENGKTWDAFPFFEWCRSLGEGWYAPAKEELETILIAINGKIGKYDGKRVNKISKLIKQHKGDGLVSSGAMSTSKDPYWMLSSTETENGMVYQFKFNESIGSTFSPLGGFLVKKTPKGKVEVIETTKTQAGKLLYGSRAVHKF